MPITRLRLLNWCQFRGEHVLELDPEHRFLALVGPNWGGKTNLLGAIRFALFDESHTGESLDRLVSWGEDRAEVELSFSGPRPFTVLRTIKKDRSYIEVEGLRDAGKAESSKAIVDRVGLTLDDYDNTCFVRQSHLLGLGELKPAELRQLTGRWTDRPEWPAYEARAKKRAEGLDRVIASLTTRAAVAFEDPAALESELADLRSQKDEAPAVDQAEVERLLQAIEDLSGPIAPVVDKPKIAAAEREQERITELAKALKAKLLSPEQRKATIADRDEATERLGIVREKAQQLRTICESGFDGHCPIDGGSCPAREEIEANVKTSIVERTSREEEVVRFTNLRSAAMNQLAEDDRRQQNLDRYRADWLELDESLAKLRNPVVDPKVLRARAEQLAELRAQLRAAQNPTVDPAITEARAKKIGALESRLASARATMAEVEKAKAELEHARNRRAAIALIQLGCGRSGIPALEAQVDLDRIEHDATSALLEIGLQPPFGVAFRQEKELKTWATQCYSCGDLLDSEQCGNCGAPRERKRKDELRLAFTYPEAREHSFAAGSGAQQTFGALMLRVSAFALLRRRRGAQWGTLFLDEVRRAMRPENSRATSQAIATFFGLGVDQVWDVVHGPEQSAASHVLEVVPGEKGSSLRWLR